MTTSRLKSLFTQASPGGRYQRLTGVCLAGAMSVILASCGGGGGGSTTTTGSDSCAAFTDSFGRNVSCAEVAALAGASLGFVDAIVDTLTGAGDGGVDGSAGDGAPIANTTLSFTDAKGKVVTTKTDAAGYYRINLRGLTAPLIATVSRDSRPWKSMLITDIVRAPANRKFYTINLTGLTDVVVSELAKKDGLSSPEAVTPAAISRQKAQVPGIIASLNSTISAPIVAAGLNPSTFDPLTLAFIPNQTGYDKVLETVTVIKLPGLFTTVLPVTPLAPASSTWQRTVTPSSGTPTISSFAGSSVPFSVAEVNLKIIQPNLLSERDSALAAGYVSAVISGNSMIATLSAASGGGTSTETITSSSYSGCGACGVGSVVSFTTNFSSFTTPPTTTSNASNNFVFVRTN